MRIKPIISVRVKRILSNSEGDPVAVDLLINGITEVRLEIGDNLTTISELKINPRVGVCELA